MQKFSLCFKNISTEKMYSKFRWEFNNFPSKLLLFFNIIVQIASFIISAKNGIYLSGIYKLLSMNILIIFYFVYKKFKDKYYLQDLYIIISIIFPFMAGTYFSCVYSEENKSIGFEWYLNGVIFQMFFSHLFKLRINWYNVMLAKISGFLFLMILDMAHYATHYISDQTLILAILFLFGVYFDYIEDKYDRSLWEKEYMNSKENEIFHFLIEEIPDQIIVWNSNMEIIYANKSTNELFHVSDLKAIKRKLMENIEELEFQENENYENKKKIIFLSKIQEIFQNMTGNLNFINFSAFIKTEFQKNEFDIKMKKIYWLKQDAVLMFMSKVDEKNLNARPDYVESFLNYVLGNISHDIYTPLNILLGMMENIMNSIKDAELLKQLRIAKNHGEILLNLVRIMIDLFSIRKGSITMNISDLNIVEEIENIMQLFSENLHDKQIEYKITENIPTIIKSDIVRFREILIMILNTCLETYSNIKLIFHFFPCINNKNMYDFGIDVEGEVEKDSPNKTLKNELFNTNRNRKSVCSIDNGICQNKKINFGLTFSLIDFIALCLSSGANNQVEMKTSINKENHMIFSYQFKIQNILSFETLALTLPFKEKQKFSLKFLSCNNEFNCFSEFRIPLGKSLPILHHSPFSSPSTHKWPKGNSSIIINSFGRPLCTKSDVSLEKLLVEHDGVSSIFKPKNIISCSDENQILSLSNKDSNSNKIKILNVDDNFYNLMVISNFCKMFGLEVVEAHNGLDALEKTMKIYNEKQNRFDFIFMDCDMPIMDGFLASQKINEFYEENKIEKPFVVAITANIINDDISNKCVSSGMNEIIMKPLGIKMFKDVLYKYLNINL